MKNPHIMRSEFLKLARLTPERYDNLLHQNEVALAFGAPIPAAHGHYIALDAVAMRINSELAALITRAEATWVTLTHWSIWMDGIGRAEHDMRWMYFALGALVTGTKREFLCCSGTNTEIGADFERNNFRGAKFLAVNLNALLADIREIAAAEGIEVPDPLLPRPDDAAYVALIKEGDAIRAEALKRMRERAKRRAAGREPLRAQ
jgi:hypothetical protein